MIGRSCATLIDPRDLAEAQREHLRTVELGGATYRFEYRARVRMAASTGSKSHARMIVMIAANMKAWCRLRATPATARRPRAGCASPH